jgi:H+/Cl- antiporter ClcA
MRGIFQSFTRRGIPFSAPINSEASLPGWTINRARIVLLFSLSILVAAGAAICVEGIVVLMNAVHTYSGLPGVKKQHDEYDIRILLVPVVVALIIAGILRYAGDRARRALQPFRSILLINAGIPLGLEGAVANLPFAVQGEINRGHRREKLILAAAAMTGGIAFLFGSPLMAIALVVELWIVELTWIGMIAVVLGGGTGILLHFWLIGTGPVFMMPDVTMAGLPALLGYAATGLLVGMVAVLAGKMVSGMTTLFRRLPLDRLWWPVIAAVTTGLTGYVFPEVLGAGYEHVDSLLLGQVTLQFLLVMVIGKLLLMSISLSSGIPGGTLAPLIVAGAALGLFITFLLQYMFPAAQMNYAVAALVGMTAMFAAGNRVLPAAIFFAIETTHVTAALLPVICACTLAYLMVFVLARKKVAQPAVLPEKIL